MRKNRNMRPLSAAPISLLIACISSAAPAQTPNLPARIRAQTMQVDVQPNGAAVTLMHTELQLLTPAAVTGLGQFPVGYIASLQDVDIVEAYTQKADGRKLQVDRSSIITRQPPGAPQLPLFTDAMQKVIVFPNVEPGDTVVFTARVRDKTPMFPGHVEQARLFPPTLPIDSYDAVVTAPKRLGLQLESHDIEFKKTESGNNDVFTAHYANLNPVTEDIAAVSQLDRVPRFFISNFKDYGDLAQSYWGMIQAKSAVTSKIRAQADMITQGMTDRREQAKAIYEWVSQHVRYVAVAFGQGAIIPHEAESVLTNAFGDCKDHTVLFMALLKAKGIDAQPALINLGNGYTLSSTPTIAQLNHMIAWLPEFGIYADTTAGVVPFGYMAQSEYGKPVVLVGKPDSGLRQTPVMPADAGTITYRNAGKLDGQMHLSAEGTTTATGAFVAQLRLAATRMAATGPDTAAGNELKQRGFPNATGTFVISNPVGLVNEYSIGSKFSTPGALNVRIMDPGLRVEPAVGDFLMGPENTKLKDTDVTPCYSGKQVEDLSLEFPANRTLTRLPQDADIQTANLHYTSRWSLDGQILAVHREFTSSIDQPLCSGDIRKQTAEALARIRADLVSPISLVVKSDFPPVTVSFSPTDRTVVKASPDSAGDAPTTQSGLPSSDNAPHIDSFTISQDRAPNGAAVVIREVVFHSPKGNAATMHFDVISTSSPAPNIQTNDGKIMSSSDQQKRSALYITRFNCGPFRTAYSVVQRGVIIDADGERSNTVDFTVRCPGAAPQ